MPRVNKTRYAALGFLMMQPMSGYDIKKFMQKSTNYFWMESDGQLYPILHKLVDEGLLTSKQEDTGARKRRLYSITDKGIKEFEGWMAQYPESPVKRYELSLKFFFGNFVKKDILIEHLNEELRKAKEQSKDLAVIKETLEQDFADSPGYKYWKILVRKGELADKAFVDWAKESLVELSRSDYK
jgi:PadR family transcriptional regulator, regulatory protein AphA